MPDLNVDPESEVELSAQGGWFGLGQSSVRINRDNANTVHVRVFALGCEDVSPLASIAVFDLDIKECVRELGRETEVEVATATMPTLLDFESNYVLSTEQGTWLGMGNASIHLVQDAEGTIRTRVFARRCEDESDAELGCVMVTAEDLAECIRDNGVDATPSAPSP